MSKIQIPNMADEAIDRSYWGFVRAWYKFFERLASRYNAQVTGWTAATGISDTGAYAVYTGTAIANPPTQAQVQAVDAELVKQSKRMVAMEQALRSIGAIDG